VSFCKTSREVGVIYLKEKYNIILSEVSLNLTNFFF
jgi:hypothetical protein